MRLLSLLAILGTIFFVFQANAAFFGLFDRSIENVTAQEGNIIINTSALSKGSSRHYRYQEGGKSIKFFVVRDGQNTIRAALDACDVCWKSSKGYKLADGAMMCVSCGMKFPLNRIGIASGGCNPHPFRFRTENNFLLITAQELMLGANYFPENNR